ncbi:MAG: IPT/TIG domain-containing protein [Rhodoplanes sp.]|nr:IPT/TIG domain-containing protein [Rhodoplanes sp.]
MITTEAVGTGALQSKNGPVASNESVRAERSPRSLCVRAGVGDPGQGQAGDVMTGDGARGAATGSAERNHRIGPTGGFATRWNAAIRALGVRALGLLALGVLASLATAGSASAACTVPSTLSGASIAFTSVGETISICITDDQAKWGLFPALGVQSNFNGPIGNTAGTVDVPTYSYADYTYTTAKAVYLLHPVKGGASFGADEVQVTLQSQSGTGSESLSLYSSSHCSDSGSCTGPPFATRADSQQFPSGPTDTLFSIAVTLPAVPVVTGLSPTSGPTAGTNSVVITGTGFTGATAVKFGATNATGYTVNSATQITATAPAGTGTVHVTVTTPIGTSATSAADQYTYVPAPTVTGIAPTTGPTTGGTPVTITGTDFTGVTAVTFGATPATGFTFNSATSITATAPAGSGTVDVRVTTPGGTSATSAADQFTYVLVPIVSSIAPISGPLAGGTTVTITGSNFTGVTAVAFGATPATGFTFNSATSITATAPAGTGTVDVTVTTPTGTSATSAADQFTYVAGPTVTAVTPNAGPLAGGISVTITGTGFTGVTAVAFGATPATGFTFNSATSITATAPSGTGTVDIRVTTPGGTSPTGAADQFTYVAAPTVTGVSPNIGSVTGGTSVTITGTSFVGVTAVSFGGTAATSFTVNSATSITATTPAHASGTVNVVVTAAGGTGTGTNLFTFAVTPIVTSVAPTAGPAAGGTAVTITGSNFTGATAVTFGGTAATGVAVVNATTITATTPAHAPGAVDITVTTPAGPGTGTGLYTYNAAPTVTAVTPGSGPIAGGTTVTITGTGFTGTTGVTFGGTAAASFTVNSATSITATTPPHAAGSVDVVVTALGGTGTGAGLFSYAAPATTTSVASSRNPSEAGQPVTFTATVTSSGGTPTGTVTFNDGGVALGTATLAGGTAAFTTTALRAGRHTITAVYAGTASFAASTSSALIQEVNTPADSLRLRALQLIATKTIAQASGAAISGAIDTAIAEGFSDGGALFSPSSTGVRFNFAADPATASADDAATDRARSAYAPSDPASSAAGGRGSGRGQPAGNRRVDDAFASLDRNVVKADPSRPRFVEPRDWLMWAEVRGTGVSNYTPSNSPSVLYGTQVNALIGLTRKLTPDLLIGAVGGWETFDYKSDTLTGHFKGDGWTVGSYLGWRFGAGLRFDAAVAYSGLDYNGTSGTASGTFDGHRWLVSGGLTGTSQLYGLWIEPSARVYALWEHENGYTDSLGTPQDARNFFTGRASGGVKVAYPWIISPAVTLSPYAGLYADYYFSKDDAAAVILAGAPLLASVPLLEGWSARATGGVSARFGNGASIALGAELGGIGSDVQIWSFRGRASVPF